VALGIPLIFGASYLLHRFAFGDEIKTIHENVELALAGSNASAEPGGTLRGWFRTWASR
jgi:hypothetical protein